MGSTGFEPATSTVRRYSHIHFSHFWPSFKINSQEFNKILHILHIQRGKKRHAFGHNE